MVEELHPIEIDGLDRPRVWMVPPSDGDGADQSGAARAPSSAGPRVWGLSPEERLRRVLLAAPEIPGEAEIVVASDLVLDEKVVSALWHRPGTLLLDESGRAAAACVCSEQRDLAAQCIRGRASASTLERIRPEQLVDTYDPRLRKDMPPVVTRLTFANTSQLEARLFRASYKGVTDFVTMWLWPLPARAVTRALARLGVTPNAVTLLNWLLVIAATLLFARGEFAWGLAAAWWMTFLDTVDGKLARVTLQSSRLGHVLDHGLDLVHPPFWYAAWALGTHPTPPWWEAALWCVIGGYVAGRLLEGVFLLLFRIETHSWRPLDSWFRSVTARRNPNLALLTIATLSGRPEIGFAAVAVWTGLSLLFHVVRLLQAAVWRLRGHRVEPWYSAPGVGAAR